MAARHVHGIVRSDSENCFSQRSEHCLYKHVGLLLLKSTPRRSKLQAAELSTRFTSASKMGRKPALFLDISQINSTPLTNAKSSQNPKQHTNYIDLVTKLRNPTAAEPINKWMTTDRVVGRPIGASSPKQKLVKPWRRDSCEPEVTTEAYENFFEEAMSGSLSGSMGGYVAARMTKEKEVDKEKKVGEDEESSEALNQVTSKAAPWLEEPTWHQKPVTERYAYPKDAYRTHRSDEGYLTLFASLENKDK
ncbi:hypothetical protein BU25DRAFT_411666 [Macroventuria anomochaeta]|uniref:Uncharacterized protein n=1 Tax=Macroventuria anomochaeta TaxID=301207 RepID=A0ACB6RZK2_9PLEO|nr:uncharacterized protein BU25DRAFT_411666 [Macroventuria anomochaeta]KAF2626697.1 hypothetical protein BU25DRAFT_411666 [Macroventuria anomochaeta]